LGSGQQPVGRKTIAQSPKSGEVRPRRAARRKTLFTKIENQKIDNRSIVKKRKRKKQDPEIFSIHLI
jgi:hypothetical protein